MPNASLALRHNDLEDDASKPGVHLQHEQPLIQLHVHRALLLKDANDATELCRLPAEQHNIVRLASTTDACWHIMPLDRSALPVYCLTKACC